MKYFMGIDAGTQGARIGVYDLEGNCVASGSKSWKTDFPKPSWAQQNPQTWWDSIMYILENDIAKLPNDIKKNILTVCVDATSSTVLALDKNGNPLRDAIMWMDIRATKEAEEINATNHEILKYCGGADSPEFFIPKLIWIKNNEKPIYDKTKVFCEQLDWINFKLSGKICSSICTSTCKANYVKSLGGYSDEFFKLIGFEDWEDKICKDVLSVGQDIGVVKEEITSKFGLNKNLMLVQGGIDAHIGMFGTNSIKEGRLCMIMGTSFCHMGLSNTLPKVEGIWGPYEDAVLDGTWCLEAGQASAAGLVQWFAQNFNINNEYKYDILSYAAKTIPVGSEGLIVSDNFQGNRTPYKDPHAKGIIYGLTMQHTWQHIYRAVLESIAFGTYNIIENFETQDVEIDEIVGCGGVTKDSVFMQIISDVCGKPIIVNKDAQGGSLGCAVIGAAVKHFGGNFQEAANDMVHTKKVIYPNVENHKKYLEIFEKYKALYQNTKSLNN